MNVLLLLSHAIEEYDQVRLLTRLGYDVFSIGAYSEPANPGVTIRPPLPEAADHPELREACHRKRVEHENDGWFIDVNGDQRHVIDWAKADLAQEVIDWCDVIIVHHFEHTWLYPQMGRFHDKRVIWRTVGQSAEYNERMMAPLRAEGLEIVRYSPKEENIPGYAGGDALIRFYKDPEQWYGWTGESEHVFNIAQHDRVPHARDPYLNFGFWEQATDGLPAVFAGSHSDMIGGLGELTTEEMQAYLRESRVYLYTGTQSASYTLGLIEAMMTGTPVVSIGPGHMTVQPYGPDIFEGHELVPGCLWSDDPMVARGYLAEVLDDYDKAGGVSRATRDKALTLFSEDVIGPQWKAYLG